MSNFTVGTWHLLSMESIHVESAPSSSPIVQQGPMRHTLEGGENETPPVVLHSGSQSICPINYVQPRVDQHTRNSEELEHAGENTYRTLISTDLEKDRTISIRSFPHTTREANGILLDPKYKQYLLYCLLFILTALVVTATIVLAFLSSSAHPVIIFLNPQKTILALNVGSTISVILIGELLTGASDNLRWIFAASPNGVGIATFLILGRATGLFGVFSMILSSDRNHGHQKWCAQRFLFSTRPSDVLELYKYWQNLHSRSFSWPTLISNHPLFKLAPAT